MVVLTDDQQNPASRPTRANIIRAMHWLVAGAQPNDSLFLHFSGHGSQTEDLDGDEEDGLDETILPEDFKTAGMIVDDEMHDILVKPLPAGCRLTALFDCCHSGSVLDLPYEYSVNGREKEPNLMHEAAKGLLNAGVSYARGDVENLITVGMTLFNKATKGKAAREKTRLTKSSPADVIQLSGCKDDQKSADTVAAVFPFSVTRLIGSGRGNWCDELGVPPSAYSSTSTKLSTITSKCSVSLGREVRPETRVECKSSYRHEHSIRSLIYDPIYDTTTSIL